MAVSELVLICFFQVQLGNKSQMSRSSPSFILFQIQPITLTRSILDGSPLATPLAPHVQPQYYAAIIAGEAIGPCGHTRVIELSINNTRVSGYAFFDGIALKRAVLINSEAFLTTTTTRTSVHVNLAFVGTGAPTSMTVKRLAIP